MKGAFDEDLLPPPPPLPGPEAVLKLLEPRRFKPPKRFMSVSGLAAWMGVNYGAVYKRMMKPRGQSGVSIPYSRSGVNGALQIDTKSPDFRQWLEEWTVGITEGGAPAFVV